MIAMKKKSMIIITILGIIILIIAISLLTTNKIIKSKTQIKIITATINCPPMVEQFYEDDKYTYSFPCVQSTSTYVKFANGNKMLVIDALEEKKVTIEELIDAGLKVYKNEK